MNKKSNKKVVIFDDDEDILSICTYVLEERGWEVHTFTNCNDVTQKVAQVVPDVILMDNRIPDAGGIEATRELKNTEKLKNIPVIYFSADSDIQSLAANAGAEAFLAKPFDLNDMEKIIDKAIDKQ